MRKFLTILLAVVLLLGALAVVADRVLLARAEERLSAAVSARTGVVGEPTVTIHGVPFLTQLLTARLEHVSVRAEGLQMQGVRMSEVTAELWGVSTTAPHTVQQLGASGTIPLAVVQRHVDEAAPGGLDLAVSVEDEALALGTEVFGAPVALIGRPVAEGGAVELRIDGVRLGGEVAELADLGLEAMDRTIDVPLTGLPEGVAVTGAEVVDDGVRLDLHGEDVALQDVQG